MGSSASSFREYYQKTTVGWVCTVTEDEFVAEAQEFFEQGYVLQLQATKEPNTIDLSKSYIKKALDLGDEVLEPVAFLK